MPTQPDMSTSAVSADQSPTKPSSLPANALSNKSIALRIVATIISIVGVVLVAVVGLQFLSLEWEQYVVEGSMVMVLTALITLIWAPGTWTRKGSIAVLLATALVVAATYVADYQAVQLNNSEGDIQEAIPSNIDLTEYTPFASKNLAQLDSASTLKFDSSKALPRLDCAAALVPYTASVFEANYPKDAAIASAWTTTNQGAIEDNQETDVLASLQYNNSSEGFYALVDKETDMFIGGKPSEEQSSFAIEAGQPLESTPIGKEAFVFIVHKDNPVQGLTTQQVKDIYTGKITNWSQVGGSDTPIQAFQRAEGSGSQTRMEAFMDGTPLQEAPMSQTVDTMAGLIEEVANYRNAAGSIGYSFRYYVTDLVGEYDVKLLSIDGVEPTIENIEDGSYPLSGNIVATTLKSNTNPNVKALIAWMRGPQGQELIRKSGYAGL